MDAINLTQHSFALKAKYNPEHRFKDDCHIQLDAHRAKFVSKS
jgi:hypothetical protein